MTADLPATPSRWKDIFLALRPNQWTKNAVVLAAFFFAYWDRSRAAPLDITSLLLVIPAVIVFCMFSSGIYLLNDIRDREADRHHPEKRNRPIAAGRMTVKEGFLLSALLILLGMTGAFFLSPRFALVGLSYLLLQVFYTLWLKHVAVLDAFSIAAGFVLRAVAGAEVLPGTAISPWLLICTFLLALFLALCKRRHEKNVVTDDGSSQRPTLGKYNTRILDSLIRTTGLLTIVFYACYTCWPTTVEKFGTYGLVYTSPFVAFGIFRYLHLVYRKDLGQQPERILVTDVPLLVDILLYVACAIVVLRLQI